MFRSDGERRSFSVTRDMTVIGRREDCDLRIPLTEVSRKHARLVRDGDALRLEDLGSSNGTYLNGQRVQEAILSAGDSVQIGPIVFVLQVDGMPADEELRPITADIHEQSAPAVVASAPGPLLPPIPPEDGDELGGELGTIESGVADEFEALEPLAMDDVEAKHEPAPQLAEHVDDAPIEMSSHGSNASDHQAAPATEEEEEFGEELLMTPDGDMDLDLAPREEAKPAAKAPAPPAAGRSAPPPPVAPVAAPVAFKAPPPPPPAPRPMVSAPPAPPAMPPVSAAPSPKPSAAPPPPPPAPSEESATSDEPQEDWDSFLVLEEETVSEAEPELVEFADLESSPPAGESESEPLPLSEAHSDEHLGAESMELADEPSIDEPSAPGPGAVAAHDSAPEPLSHSREHSDKENAAAWDDQTATKPLSFAGDQADLEPALLDDGNPAAESPSVSDGESDPELDALFADLADEAPAPFSAHESEPAAIPSTTPPSNQTPMPGAHPSNGNGAEPEVGHAMHAHSEADVMPLLGDESILEDLPLLDDEGELGILPDNAGHGADAPHHPHA